MQEEYDRRPFLGFFNNHTRPKIDKFRENAADELIDEYVKFSFSLGEFKRLGVLDEKIKELVQELKQDTYKLAESYFGGGNNLATLSLGDITDGGMEATPTLWGQINCGNFQHYLRQFLKQKEKKKEEIPEKKEGVSKEMIEGIKNKINNKEELTDDECFYILKNQEEQVYNGSIPEYKKKVFEHENISDFTQQEFRDLSSNLSDIKSNDCITINEETIVGDKGNGYQERLGQFLEHERYKSFKSKHKLGDTCKTLANKYDIILSDFDNCLYSGKYPSLKSNLEPELYTEMLKYNRGTQFGICSWVGFFSDCESKNCAKQVEQKAKLFSDPMKQLINKLPQKQFYQLRYINERSVYNKQDFYKISVDETVEKVEIKDIAGSSESKQSMIESEACRLIMQASSEQQKTFQEKGINICYFDNDIDYFYEIDNELSVKFGEKDYKINVQFIPMRAGQDEEIIQEAQGTFHNKAMLEAYKYYMSLSDKQEKESYVKELNKIEPFSKKLNEFDDGKRYRQEVSEANKRELKEIKNKFLHYEFEEPDENPFFFNPDNKAKADGVFNKLLQKKPNLIHITQEQVANVFTSEKTELSLLELRFLAEFRKECKEQGLQTSDEKSPRSNNFFSLFKGDNKAEQKQNMNAYFEERFQERDRARDAVYKTRMREIGAWARGKRERRRREQESPPTLDFRGKQFHLYNIIHDR